jgi:carbonic anhydrase/acetyltransferase-like protein (isoleucine patch superfamily)
MAAPLIVSIRGHTPQLHAESWVAPNASVIGQVILAARVSVWYSATLRAEAEQIEVGFGSNIQDGVTVHVDKVPVHRPGDRGSQRCRMAAPSRRRGVCGSGVPTRVCLAWRVPPGSMVIPARSLVTGVPGRVRRELSAAEVANNRYNAEVYRRLLDLHRASSG